MYLRNLTVGSGVPFHTPVSPRLRISCFRLSDPHPTYHWDTVHPLPASAEPTTPTTGAGDGTWFTQPAATLFTDIMSTPIAVARTAPIPIAPKPSRQLPSRQGSTILDAYPHSMSGLTSPGSDSPLSGQPATPCEACLRRRIKCIMSDDDDDSSCISCQANHVDCSLTGSPQPRKRKLKGDLEVSHSKRR